MAGHTPLRYVRAIALQVTATLQFALLWGTACTHSCPAHTMVPHDARIARCSLNVCMRAAMPWCMAASSGSLQPTNPDTGPVPQRRNLGVTVREFQLRACQRPPPLRCHSQTPRLRPWPPGGKHSQLSTARAWVPAQHSEHAMLGLLATPACIQGRSACLPASSLTCINWIRERGTTSAPAPPGPAGAWQRAPLPRHRLQPPPPATCRCRRRRCRPQLCRQSHCWAAAQGHRS